MVAALQAPIMPSMASRVVDPRAGHREKPLEFSHQSVKRLSQVAHRLAVRVVVYHEGKTKNLPTAGVDIPRGRADAGHGPALGNHWTILRATSLSKLPPVVPGH